MRRFEKWAVAYRIRNGRQTLLDDRTSRFTSIPNTWRYWAGDPHAIEENGKTFVFAELYDRILRRGVIGCCELDAQGPTPWKIVLKQPFHLSYPHLLRQGEDIYMIPESYVGREIAVYKAVHFPERWEKVKVLKSEWVTVDSTVFGYDRRSWMLTLQFDKNHEKLVLFSVDHSGLSSNGLVVSVDDVNKRPAGYFFADGERLIRPAQDCSESYGCALNLYEVEQVSEEAYSEQLILKLRPEDIYTDLRGTPAGLHTYNTTEHYELIDLKEYETDYWFWVMRPVWFIWRRVKRVFGR